MTEPTRQPLQQPLQWNPEALVHHPLIEHVHVAPNSKQVLYTVRAAHLTDDASEFRDRIFLVDTEDVAVDKDVAVGNGENPMPRQLTHDLGASMPKWSPDGQLIAFLRTLPQSKHKGLWLMSAQGGEPWPLIPPTQSQAQFGQPPQEQIQYESVQKFEWRPDGRAIAFTAVPADAERRRRQRQKDDVQRWRVDYDWAHLFLVEFELPPIASADSPFAAADSGPSAYSGKPIHSTTPLFWRQLTTGTFHVESLAWHPHSSDIAFTAQDTPYIDSWPSMRLQCIRFSTPSQTESAKQDDTDTDGVAPTSAAQQTAQPARPDSPIEITAIASDIAAWKSTPAYSPDGEWIACEAGIDDNHWAYAGRVHIYPTARSSTATGRQGIHAQTPTVLADVSDAQPILIGWTPDSRHVLVYNEQGLGTEVLALPIDGGAPQTVVAGEDPCAVANINQQGLLALVRQNYHKLNGVEIIDLSRGLAAATDAPWRIATPQVSDYPAAPLPQIRELRWRTPDGFEIEGVLYLPHDFDPDSHTARDTNHDGLQDDGLQEDGPRRKLPLLLHIHGGPMSVFQRAYAGVPYYYPVTALCELGFAVLRANPRGSSGYGKDFRFANIEDWGEGDYRDLMQGVDTVIEMGIADPDRLGVCGWSYGGFMSSWIITQTHRFQAASIGAPLTNPMSFPATADIATFVPNFYGGEAWQNFEFYIEHGPIFGAHKVRTPSIIQHGAADERVPLEQGLQYYHVLQRNNVPVELYIYPRQGHAILEPRLLIDAMRRNLEWFVARLAPANAHKMRAAALETSENSEIVI